LLGDQGRIRPTDGAGHNPKGCSIHLERVHRCMKAGPGRPGFRRARRNQPIRQAAIKFQNANRRRRVSWQAADGAHDELIVTGCRIPRAQLWLLKKRLGVGAPAARDNGEQQEAAMWPVAGNSVVILRTCELLRELQLTYCSQRESPYE